jgi:hypothetical protein
MYIDRLFSTDEGKIFVSIILALGVVSLFKTKGKKIEYERPTNTALQKIYKFDTKCYKFNYNAGICDKNKRIVK